MESVVKNSKVAPKKEYPYLGKFGDNNLVVLFTAKEKGIVVHPSQFNPIGCFDDCWAEDKFAFFEGTVELSND